MSETNGSTAQEGKLEMIPLDQLKPHPKNPRLAFRKDVVDGIAFTLKAEGRMRRDHALRVRPLGENEYQIVGGHQRREAAAQAGLTEVPCWVFEMTDGEAYMALVLDNRHGELSPLEIGWHAGEVAGRGAPGRGKEGGLRLYARQFGMADSTLTKYVHAAEVAKMLPPEAFSQVIDLHPQLYAIHGIPQAAWAPMVQAMLDGGWKPSDTQKALARFKAYYDKPTVAGWEEYLPVVGCALAVSTQGWKESDFRWLESTVRATLKALESWENLNDADRGQLAGEWRNWLESHQGGDSWDTEKVSAKRAELEKRAWALADAAAVEGDQGVTHGDFREVGKGLAVDSVDLIFTDPPYDRAALPMYGDMAALAARVLKPGGSLICYLGQYQIGEVCRLVEPHLRLWWTLCCLHTGNSARMTEYGIVVKWKPMLWFVKGTRGDKHTWVEDLAESEPEKDTHEWQQGTKEAAYYIEHLCPADGFVFDPFCGGGTTAVAAKRLGRSWLTCDVDEEAVADARRRISGAQG